MLGLAGCEYGDLAKLVKKEGMEGALGVLFHKGVYLSVNEYKGRVPTLRGTSTIEVGSNVLSNPLSQSHLRLHTSGSSGQNTFVPVDLAFIRERSANHRLLIEARRGFMALCRVGGSRQYGYCESPGAAQFWSPAHPLVFPG